MPVAHEPTVPEEAPALNWVVVDGPLPVGPDLPHGAEFEHAPIEAPPKRGVSPRPNPVDDPFANPVERPGSRPPTHARHEPPRRRVHVRKRFLVGGAVAVVALLAVLGGSGYLPPVIRVPLPVLPKPRLPRIEVVKVPLAGTERPAQDAPEGTARSSGGTEARPVGDQAPQPQVVTAPKPARREVASAARPAAPPVAPPARTTPRPAPARTETEPPTIVSTDPPNPKPQPAATRADGAPAKPSSAPPAATPVASGTGTGTGTPPAQAAPTTAAPTTAAAPVKTPATPAPAPSSAPAVDPNADWPLLCGVVVDESGSPVAGAKIALADLDIATRTDRRGHFCVAAPPGDRTLSVMAQGFATHRRIVSLGAQGLELSIAIGSRP